MTHGHPIQSDNGSVPVRRHRMDSLDLYDVTEDELEILEKGPSTNTKLTIATALISTGISFVIALLITKIESVLIQTIFVVFATFGLGVGIILLILWWRTDRDSVKPVIKRIKARKLRNSSETTADTEDPSVLIVEQDDE